MDLFDKQRIVEMVSYILNETGGADVYHIVKILYFAEQKHLVKWGAPLISDDFVKMDYGPVPTETYDALKVSAKGEFADLMRGSYKRAREDARGYLLPIRTADMDYISASEKEALDASIKENAGLPFGQLKTKSHDSAYHCGKRYIPKVKIAEAGNADADTIGYIKDQEELRLLLV